MKNSWCTIVALSAAAACADPASDQRRAGLVAEIERDVSATAANTGRHSLDPLVMRAIGKVPRHEFVPEDLKAHAYENRPLPIGEGQTISQPFIVALMTDLARVNPKSVVLEIGTGSGYQAAVLAELVDHVYTIEIVESLGRNAAATLQRLGYDNVTVKVGDGYAGWPEHAPFDAIIVTAAPDEVPQPLLQQLRAGGRIVVPVGDQGTAQSLQVIQKDDSGAFTTTDVLPVLFVPFTRER